MREGLGGSLRSFSPRKIFLEGGEGGGGEEEDEDDVSSSVMEGV